eukprot:CAMPEP_0194421708 /NCGR_PEP_ID=MMETSP0176-20130528/20959_1 /TAXON_ID=216777 /ORGANISM="Proboscia alata, Strain PI-D3" /LENGTH=338 /DNA_ID=CAMNT_0039229999 /DNA_START=212 /DNA_END=1228 /DNA_ORIENTATION=-
MGLKDELIEECEDTSYDDIFEPIMEFDVTEGYQLATSVFSHLAACDRKATQIWLPQFRNRGGEIERLTSVLNDNSDRLGGLFADFQHWPEVPASMVEFQWSDETNQQSYEKETPDETETAVRNTHDYVDNHLCGLGLCPFTKSMKRAAIGLDSVGVREGPVIVRHSADVISSTSTSPAAVTAAMYWQGVSEIIEQPETSVATHLLVAPKCYDDDFKSFFKTCDNLIEKTVILSPGSVGRVWFHPKYKLSEVGYTSGGHAPPLHEIDGLFDTYVAENPQAERPDEENMAKAHDKTRWTPHATINLLRAKQLKAATDNRNRARVFPRNILKLLSKNLVEI